jgi:ribosome modulation factor
MRVRARLPAPLLAAAILAGASNSGSAQAEAEFPQFDIDRACTSSILGRSPESCQFAEAEARAHLKDLWRDARPAARSLCIGLLANAGYGASPQETEAAPYELLLRCMTSSRG